MAETGDGTADRRQPRRWRVLDAVSSVATPATVDEIVDELHDRRAPSDPLAGLESWDRTHQRLHEVDLPALSAAGLIEFDRERGIVTVPPEAAESGFGPANVAATHERRDDQGRTDAATGTGRNSTAGDHAGGDRPGDAMGPTAPGSEIEGIWGIAWPHWYLAATIVSTLLVVGSIVSPVPGLSYPSTLAAAIAVALFAILALGHQLTTAR